AGDAHALLGAADHAAVVVAEVIALRGVVAAVVRDVRDTLTGPADLAVAAIVVVATRGAGSDADPRVGVAEAAIPAIVVAGAHRLALVRHEVAELSLAAIGVRGTLLGPRKLTAAELAVAELRVADLPLRAILVALAVEETDGLLGFRTGTRARVLRVVTVVRVKADLAAGPVHADLVLGAIVLRFAARGFVLAAADERERGECRHTESKNEPVKSRHGLLLRPRPSQGTSAPFTPAFGRISSNGPRPSCAPLWFTSATGERTAPEWPPGRPVNADALRKYDRSDP